MEITPTYDAPREPRLRRLDEGEHLKVMVEA
jgi:hypothetical protein